MSAIYLIRHGQASFGADDYDKLSETGHSQAQVLGQFLKDKNLNFDQVVTGDMLRHKQTANGCLAAWNEKTNAQQDPRWNEYDHEQIIAVLDKRFATNQGVREYLMAQADPKLALQQIFHRAMMRWQSGDFDSDYHESWQDFMQRTQQGLQDIIASQAKTTAVFTSGGPISWMICHHMGITQQDFLRINWTLINCGVTKLVKSSQGVFVSSMNEQHGFESHPQAKTLITYR